MHGNPEIEIETPENNISKAANNPFANIEDDDLTRT